MILCIYSAAVSLAYAVLALAAPGAARVTVVAFVALLIVPAGVRRLRVDGSNGQRRRA